MFKFVRAVTATKEVPCKNENDYFKNCGCKWTFWNVIESKEV